MEISELQPLNPWFAIWIRPRETIRYIVAADVNYHLYLLATIVGVLQTLGSAIESKTGDILPWYVVVIGILVVGPLSGVLNLYIGGAVFRWVGSRLGGSGTFKAVRAAYAWSFLPNIIGAFPYILYVLLFRSEAFSSKTPQFDVRLSQNPALSSYVFGWGLLLMIGGFVSLIWQPVILSNTLGEVHGFSAWRGLLTFLIPVVIISILLFAILVLL